jgi:hypothetical protein
MAYLLLTGPSSIYKIYRNIKLLYCIDLYLPGNNSWGSVLMLTHIQARFKPKWTTVPLSSGHRLRSVSGSPQAVPMRKCTPNFSPWRRCGRACPTEPFSPGVVARNGTAFFLQTNQALFGVTAAHVIEGRNSWRSHCELYGKHRSA